MIFKIGKAKEDLKDRFTCTVFQKVEVTNYPYGVVLDFSKMEKSSALLKLMTSNRIVCSQEGVLYECKKNEEIIWVNEKDLVFPT